MVGDTSCPDYEYLKQIKKYLNDQSKGEVGCQNLKSNSSKHKKFSCHLNANHYEEEVVDYLLDCEMNYDYVACWGIRVQLLNNCLFFRTTTATTKNMSIFGKIVKTTEKFKIARRKAVQNQQSGKAGRTGRKLR